MNTKNKHKYWEHQLMNFKKQSSMLRTSKCINAKNNQIWMLKTIISSKNKQINES